MRKRMLARTYQPTFFSNMAVGVPEGRCTKAILAAVSSGNGLVLALEVTENKKKEM